MFDPTILQIKGADGPGRVNIHLYYSETVPTANGSETLDGRLFANALSRFQDVVSTLNEHANSNENLRKVLVGEIGFPSAGVLTDDRNAKRASFIADVKAKLTGANQIVFWRLFKDFLRSDGAPLICTDTNCGAGQASESTYGFLGFFSGAIETQFKTEFAKSWFSWRAL